MWVGSDRDLYGVLPGDLQGKRAQGHSTQRSPHTQHLRRTQYLKKILYIYVTGSCIS